MIKAPKAEIPFAVIVHPSKAAKLASMVTLGRGGKFFLGTYSSMISVMSILLRNDEGY